MPTAKLNPKLLRVNKDYRVTSDTICFTVEERHIRGEESKNPGEEYWRPISFHPSLESVFASLCDQVSLNVWPNLPEILKEISSIRKMLTEIKSL